MEQKSNEEQQQQQQVEAMAKAINRCVHIYFALKRKPIYRM